MTVSTIFPINKFHFRSEFVLDGLLTSELEFFKSKLITNKYKKGKNLFVEGSYPSGVFFIDSGIVKKFKEDRDGKEQIIYICGKRELLGYSALLCDETYSDSAKVLEDSIISFIDKNDFLKFLEISPTFTRNLLKNLSHEFGVLENNIKLFAHKNVRERLAISLLLLKDKLIDNGQNDEYITLTREDLSNLVGTALETLVRLIHDFKHEVIIETQGRKIKILNSKKLVKIANLI